MNIVVLNQHGGNYGDDAAGRAALFQIRKHFPQSNIAIVYNDSGGVEPIPLYVASRVTHVHNKIAKSDLLAIVLYVIGQGRFGRLLASQGLTDLLSILSKSEYVVVSPSGQNIGIYRDWRFLIRVIAAIISKRAPIFHLNSIGASGNICFDLLAAYALRRSILFVRERRSYEYLKTLGIKASIGVDSAFSLPALYDINTRQEIVLIVTDLTKWFRAFYDFDMARFISELATMLVLVAKRRNLSIRVIPHLHSFMEERPFLESVVLELRKRQGVGEVTILDDTYENYEGYERRIAESVAVVSMRYHGVILSAKNGVPFVAISYENKMAEVCSYCCCMDTYVDIRAWNAKEFEQKIDLVLNERFVRAESLRSRLPILRRLAIVVDDYMWLIGRNNGD